MRLPILQACGKGKLEPVETTAYSCVSLLGGHYHVKAAVNVDGSIDRSLIVVRIPGITGNKITVGDIVAALVIRRAASAACSSRRIQRKICICPTEFHGYCVRLTVSEAGRGMEYEPVVRAANVVSQVLPVKSAGYG